MLLEGIFSAITTPFYPDGRLYLRKLEHNVDRYSRTPISGITVLGSTGEAIFLSDDESREVLKTAREAAAPDKVLLAGVARESLQETLSLAEFAAKHHYDAVLVRTPHYYAPQMGNREILTYYRTLADRSPLPVVLYSIPKFTNYEIPVDVVEELAWHPNIIGLKDSSGSAERIAEVVSATQYTPKRQVTVTPVFTAVTRRMLAGTESATKLVTAEQLLLGGTAVAAVPEKAVLKTRTREIGFQVLSGAAHQVKSAMDAGATGAVLAFGSCAPQACVEIYMAWKDRDAKLAEEKQTRLEAASKRVAGALGVPGLKYACDLNGYYGGLPRLPLLSLTAEEKAEVDLLMAGLRN